MPRPSAKVVNRVGSVDSNHAHSINICVSITSSIFRDEKCVRRQPTPSHADLVHEKVSHIAELLRGWGWSFSDLVRYWILHYDGPRGKRGSDHQKRRSLPTDSDAMMNAIVFG
jgi:hypothetical protein